MKLVILTKSTFFVEEDKILAALFDEGMEMLHISKPGSSPIFSERLLSLLPEEYYKKIVVHDHFYLKNEFGLAGIHLDSDAIPVPDGYRGKVSRTCTDLDKLREMKRNSQYVFLRNIFDSVSDKEQKGSFTTEQLLEASRKGLIDKKVYAMGGITLDNVRLVRDMGFGGVVVCGDLWNQFDIHNEVDYKQIIQRFNMFRKAVQ